MGLGDRIREATQKANALGESTRFNQVITRLPSHKVEGFCTAYLLAGGFNCTNRNSTQDKYYKELKKYL